MDSDKNTQVKVIIAKPFVLIEASVKFLDFKIL